MIDSPRPFWIANQVHYPFLYLPLDESGALSISKSQQISGLVRNIKHETAIESAKSRPRPCHIPRFRTVLSFKDWREWVLGASPNVSIIRNVPESFQVLETRNNACLSLSLQPRNDIPWRCHSHCGNCGVLLG